jgi:bacterioferritin (cytochrome b1)
MAFIDELDQLIRERLERLGAATTAGEPAAELTVAKLLTMALKNEMEATEIAALWLPGTDDVDVKLALARQVGDEAKHFSLIAKRLGELGVDPAAVPQSPPSPLFRYLENLTSTIERVAAGQFAREGIALVRNRAFIDFCRARGDSQTADLYEKIVNADEQHHHDLGRKLVARLADSPESQAAARRAAVGTLDLAEELQEMMRMKAGISRAPGC